MNLIAERLEEERKRLKKKKGQMAASGKVAPSTYTNYIDGSRPPDGNFLASIAAAGADVQYILTGIRSLNYPTEMQVKTMQAAEDRPDYLVVRKRDLINHIQNLEHCSPKIQKAIKDLAFVSASGGASETEPQDKLSDTR